MCLHFKSAAESEKLRVGLTQRSDGGQGGKQEKGQHKDLKAQVKSEKLKGLSKQVWGE